MTDKLAHLAKALYLNFRIEEEISGEGMTTFEEHAKFHSDMNEPYWKAAEILLQALDTFETNECICPKCGLRHGGISAPGDF